MIQFKRGTTSSWAKQTEPLAAGQPGYDKDRKKFKIGDGKSSWNDLPYASGLFADEILDSEENAKVKTKAKAALNPLGTLIANILNLEDRPIFTYGTDLPDKDTVGQVYLQQFEGAIEADFVVETGRNINYFFRKWNSGFIECWGQGIVPKKIEELFTTIIFKTTGDYFEIKGYWK